MSEILENLWKYLQWNSNIGPIYEYRLHIGNIVKVMVKYFSPILIKHWQNAKSPIFGQYSKNWERYWTNTNNNGSIMFCYKGRFILYISPIIQKFILKNVRTMVHCIWFHAKNFGCPTMSDICFNTDSRYWPRVSYPKINTPLTYIWESESLLIT